MTSTFKVISSHPEDLDDGRVVGPGEVVSKVDADAPHNKALIEEGKLIKMESSSSRAKKSTQEGGD